jgi:Putative Ig domain
VSIALQGAAGVRPLGSFTLVGNVKTVGGRAAPSSGMTWRQISGPPVQIPSSAGASVTLMAPSAGPLAFEFTAVDSGGYAATTSVTVTVNTPPTLAPVATMKLKKGEAASGSVRASDPEGDAITYVLVSAPPGLTLDAATGAWSWKPGSDGDYTMTVMATDAYGSSSPVNVALNVEKGGIGAMPWWLVALLVVPVARRYSARPR